MFLCFFCFKITLFFTATKVITDYVVRENRPYSATDVFNNLHREYGKTLIVRCLDSAVSNEILREKTVSKQKIYFPNQDKLEVCEDAKLKEMDQLITEKNAALSTLTDEMKKLQNELKEVESSLSTAELPGEISRLESQVYFHILCN
uniref:TBPIP domain-containing protein n=1 Tax=Syphacia muris TaxID=451379 RepID=A0A0N5AP45_9BILA